jgi:hypothetical protein
MHSFFSLLGSSLVIDAVIGRYNSSKVSSITPSFFTTTNGDEINNQENTDYERIPVVQEIQHPKYSRGTLRYDMMLLRLEHPPTIYTDNNDIPFMRLDNDTSFLNSLNETTSLPTPRLPVGFTLYPDDPSSSPPDNNMTINQETLVVVGWGNTQSRIAGPPVTAEVLQQAKLGIVPNDECEKAQENFVSYRGRIYDEMLCTYASNRDSCNGKY